MEAEAVPLLVGMLGRQPAAADLLCFMATQQQCKEAFLRSKTLGSLVNYLHASASSGTLLNAAKWMLLLWQSAVCMAEVIFIPSFHQHFASFAVARVVCSKRITNMNQPHLLICFVSETHQACEICRNLLSTAMAVVSNGDYRHQHICGSGTTGKRTRIC